MRGEEQLLVLPQQAERRRLALEPRSRQVRQFQRRQVLPELELPLLLRPERES